MNYVVLLVLVIVSFASSKALLSFASPNDPEGTNLLVTTVVALVVFLPLFLVYRFLAKRNKTKN